MDKKVENHFSVDSLSSFSFDNKQTIHLLKKDLNHLNKKEKKAAQKREIVECYPLLKGISKLRNPHMRYNLTDLLFNQIINNHASLEVYNHLTDKNGQKMGTTDLSIFSLLLAPLIRQGIDQLDDTNRSTLFIGWETVLSTLSEKQYKDATIQMPVITALHSLIMEPNLNLEEKGKLIRAIFSLRTNAKSPQERAQIVNKNLGIMETIIISQNGRELTSLINQITEGRLPSESALSDVLQQIFMRNIGEVEIKEFAEKFDKTFLASRQPLAYLTYISKLQSLPSHEKQLMLPHMNSLFIDILEGKDQQNRYQNKEGEHLNVVLSWKSDETARENWKKIWTSGSSSPITTVEDDNSRKAVDPAAFLKEKICTDKHIPPQEYPLLLKTLGEKPIENSDKILEKEKKEALEKILISLIYPDSQDEKKLKSAVDLMKEIYPSQNDHPFLRDLQDLEILMNGKERSDDGWIVEDSDNWIDLLLCGTEVLGSCQNINGSIDLNKCLMNYILDGKNRVVVVKDSSGVIQARVIIRLLWDDKLKRPVLYRERLYKAAGLPDRCIQAIDDLCISKAKALGITLIATSQSEENEKPQIKPYPNALVSFNGRAPFEYVDADQLGVTNGHFTISGNNTYVVYDPN